MVMGIEVLNEYEGKAAFIGHTSHEALKSLQPADRSADTNYRENFTRR